jgi:hypothetical protein
MPTTSGFPHPVYAARVLSPNFEQTKAYLVSPMLAASRAHTVMLVRQGILDREQGAIVVVRPDQYVANALPLDAHDELGRFFAAFLLDRQ